MSQNERKDNTHVTDETNTARFRIGGRIVLVTVFLALTLFMGYLIKVQFKLQHDQYEEYSYKASQMHWQRIKDVPNRGDILDRKDRKSTRLNSSHPTTSRMPSSA